MFRSMKRCATADFVSVHVPLLRAGESDADLSFVQ
jgi:hypothetical protein